MGNDNAMRAAIDRPLLLRMRPDVVISEQWFEGRRSFVIKDPLTLVYSYLTEQEHFIWAQLDGRTSIAEIQQRFVARFAPQQVTAGQIQGFAAQLHRSGLVLGEAAGQGEQLEQRRASGNLFDLLRWVEKLLAIRWRGVNPEPLLDWLEPKVGWLFSRWGVLLWLIIVASAAAIGLLHFDEFARRWPNATTWLSGSNVVWIGIALMAVKTLHELGHALAARRMGSQCREIGIQLFFLLPCLYTNVSDIWLVPSKWRRIAVSAAGIYVELLLAAIAMLIWWRAEPGVLSSLCQSVILVASVGTLLLNGNPLMRYDGYYVLADLLGIPNLEQRSRSQLVALLAGWGTGIEWQPPGELASRPQPLLAAYAAAAVAYRAAVLVGVYFATRVMLRPLSLEPLSDVLIAGAVVGMIVPLAATLGQFLMHARRTHEMRPARLAISAASLAAIVAAAWFVPLPQRVTAPVVIEPHDASRLYATVAGVLQTSLPVGASVQEGQTIAELENLDLQRDLTRLESERRQQELRLVELETVRGDDPARAAAIPAARQSLADLDTRIGQVRELIERLTLRAPHNGIVLPPPKRRPSAQSRELSGWADTPLNEANRGAFIETGTLICLISRPGEIEAVAVVDQADAPLVQPGKKASVALAQHPGGVIDGTVDELARIESDELPLHLTATGAIPLQSEEQRVSRPLQTTYQVRIRLQEPLEVLPGTTGRVLIVAPPQTLAARVARWLSRTFRM